ncbi:Protein GRAVITROPIC IN THE LIGHT 1 [Camellia lanceoleosa]|uniref:Protein GRAVITROPIC IN THE LIGHT 1 n=1 Tax=Camellia lanceoleosa TaxID=1840588 RepID=A0ACC0F3P7_9ERIC|nr:Protein GRAVITROPIC IN THE LIGHT 1 [Camellia lanceoleosa]
MECATKPPSNISDIVSKFAKVCRFRSIGVFSTENPTHNHHQPINDFGNNVPSPEDSSDATEEAECDMEKIHPNPVEIQPKTTECANVEILELFDSISALKSAYVRLQEAHIPYDPDKIKSANELVVAHLESICKIKRAYKEKQFKEINSISASSALLLAEIHVQESLLEKLKFQVKIKNSEILNLKEELQDLDLQNRMLVQVLKKEREAIKFLNLSSFEDIFKEASKAIHDFAKPLISLMKASAYIARRMFYGMPLQSYNVDSILRSDDPIDDLIKDPYSNFAKFCGTKYLCLIHPTMEASFFGNLDHRTFVLSGKHPRTLFYQAFVKMAKWVWVLRGITASCESNAEMYGVKRGSEFSDVYMEGVEELTENIVVSDEGRSRFKVEFMVMPGFRIGETLVRSRVYLSTMRYSNCRC